ncbi:MAG: D-alanyl-D-alanine carboxypeptidase, partial [Bdellovibrionota bacterium]
NPQDLQNHTPSAAAKGITLPSLAAITMRAASISHLAKDSFNKAAAVKTFVMKSAPLFRYLKDMNNFSNNYIADQMARIAGGIPAMLQWYNEKLGFTSAQLKMVTGSGLDKDNDVDLAHREDNFATCEAVIKTMKALGTDLNAIVLTEAQKTYLGKANLGMMDVMPIAGVNQATYTGSGDQDSAVVFKTGTLGPGAVDNRLNIAGYARGQTDTRFFAMFFKYDNASQKVDIRSIRERIISKLLAEMGGPKPLQGYRATDKNDFMSVDKESKFELILAQPQG